MDVSGQIPGIIKQFGLQPEGFSVEKIGSGYIHHTFKLSGKERYILQRVNKNVFTKPEVIASNIRHAADYLHKKFPDYLFITPVKSTLGDEMVFAADGFPWRMLPYFENTITIDKVSTPDEAFSAAAAFGKLTKHLDGVDIQLFKPTIERFHDLSWRWEQFEQSLIHAKSDRLEMADNEITLCKEFSHLVAQYNSLVKSGDLMLRVTHNDTKINNVLFSTSTKQAICAIDLDTLMPGYFIYDLGDMIRTFVSPVDEEARDLTKVAVRADIYEALVRGYLSQMNDVLSEAERNVIGFSGMMMTYIMALRMLTDYLNGDIYYQIRYEDQNLVRAKNQLRLLNELQSVSL